MFEVIQHRFLMTHWDLFNSIIIVEHSCIERRTLFFEQLRQMLHLVILILQCSHLEEKPRIEQDNGHVASNPLRKT